MLENGINFLMSLLKTNSVYKKEKEKGSRSYKKYRLFLMATREYMNINSKGETFCRHCTCVLKKSWKEMIHKVYGRWLAEFRGTVSLWRMGGFGRGNVSKPSLGQKEFMHT